MNLLGFGLVALISAPLIQPELANLDPARPDSWEAQLRAPQVEMGRFARSLIAIATDRKNDDDTRRQAIRLLGKVKSPEATRFLVHNIALRIRKESMITNDDQFLDTPCYYALSTSNDWNVVPVLLDWINEERTKEELLHVASVLGAIVPRGRAEALIDNEYAREKKRPIPEPARLKNLKEVLRILRN